jgi:hypothetical protein
MPQVVKRSNSRGRVCNQVVSVLRKGLRRDHLSKDTEMILQTVLSITALAFRLRRSSKMIFQSFPAQELRAALLVSAYGKEEFSCSVLAMLRRCEQVTS